MAQPCNTNKYAKIINVHFFFANSRLYKILLRFSSLKFKMSFYYTIFNSSPVDFPSIPANFRFFSSVLTRLGGFLSTNHLSFLYNFHLYLKDVFYIKSEILRFFPVKFFHYFSIQYLPASPYKDTFLSELTS